MKYLDKAFFWVTIINSVLLDSFTDTSLTEIGLFFIAGMSAALVAHFIYAPRGGDAA